MGGTRNGKTVSNLGANPHLGPANHRKAVGAGCLCRRQPVGFEFGYGAEIGISTQKLHARGPMGLLALTTTKYIIYGNGQIRP